MTAPTLLAIAELIADITADDDTTFDSTMTLEQLAAAFDICPMHACDAQICRDDEIADCAAIID